MKTDCGRVFGSLVICLLSALSATAQQQRGMISGIVSDEKGIPVSGAKVNVERSNGHARGSLVRFVETDFRGHFLIDRLAWGRYKVFAKKEDAGYPPMNWSFYSEDSFPTATITPENPNVDLRVRIGPKGGVLVGSVSDASTGAPVNAGFKLLRALYPDKWISTSMPANYRVLIPASTDVLLEVSAPGFKTWNPGHALRLGSGAELHLDISLEPSHDPNLSQSKFLVPDGYVGWLLLEYNAEGADPVPTEAGVKVFKFPSIGKLNTSSPGPERGADYEYFYYSPDGSTREIPMDYRNSKGVIWGQHEGSRNGVMAQFGFFVGSEEQYKKYQSQAMHPGPISAQ
jgi:uncharacterized protein DUF6843